MEAQKLNDNLSQVKWSSCHLMHKSPLITIIIVEKEILKTALSTSYSQGKMKVEKKKKHVSKMSKAYLSFSSFELSFFLSKFQCNILSLRLHRLSAQEQTRPTININNVSLNSENIILTL